MLLNHRKTDSNIAIELTPLVDMVFLLIIFFLVATSFQQAEREMAIALPISKSSGPISASLREIVINISAEGNIIVGGRTVEPAALRDMIADAVEVNPDQKVVVRGDRAVAYGRVVAALDACKSGGIQEPFLDTVLE
jgi:biopolymer transport protein ExbD